MPFTQRVPKIGPAMEPRPPMTAMATMSSDSRGVKAVAVCTLGWSVTYKHPANAAIPPETAKAVSFMRREDTVEASAASSFSRTAIMERPMPVFLRRATTKAAIPKQIRQK